VLVATLFRLDGVPLNAGDFAMDGRAFKIGEFDAGQREDGHVAVGQEVNIAGVVQDARHIGGHKRLAFRPRR